MTHEGDRVRATVVTLSGNRLVVTHYGLYDTVSGRHHPRQPHHRSPVELHRT
jgi:hypothetical protein